MEKLESLKQKYGKVYELIIEDEGVTYKGYFRRPDVDTIAAFTKLAKTDEMKAAKTLVTNCMVDGDEAIKTDGILLLSAAGQFGQIITSVKTSLKNL